MDHPRAVGEGEGEGEVDGNRDDNISGPDPIAINIGPDRAWPLSQALTLFLPRGRLFSYFREDVGGGGGGAGGRGIIQHVDAGQLVANPTISFPQGHDRVGTGNPSLQYLPPGAAAHGDRPPVGEVVLDPVYIDHDERRGGDGSWTPVHLFLFFLTAVLAVSLASRSFSSSSSSAAGFSSSFSASSPSSAEVNPNSTNSSSHYPHLPSLLDIRIQMHHLAAENSAFATALEAIASSPGLHHTPRTKEPDGPQSLHSPHSFPPRSLGSGSPPSSRIASGSIPDNVRALWTSWITLDMEARRLDLCETLLTDLLAFSNLGFLITSGDWTWLNFEDVEEGWDAVMNDFMEWVQQQHRDATGFGIPEPPPPDEDMRNELLFFARVYHICSALGNLTMHNLETLPVKAGFGLPGFTPKGWTIDLGRFAATPRMSLGPHFVRRMNDLMTILCEQPMFHTELYDILTGIVSLAEEERWDVRAIGSGSSGTDSRAGDDGDGDDTSWSSWLRWALSVFSIRRQEQQQMKASVGDAPVMNLTINAVVLQIISQTAHELDRALEYASPDPPWTCDEYYSEEFRQCKLINMARDAAELIRLGEAAELYDQALLATADAWIAASRASSDLAGRADDSESYRRTRTLTAKLWSRWTFVRVNGNGARDYSMLYAHLLRSPGMWKKELHGRAPLPEEMGRRRERLQRATAELRELGRWQQEYLGEVANLKQQIRTAFAGGGRAREAARRLQDTLAVVFSEFAHTGRLRLAGADRGTAWELVQDRLGVKVPETTGEFLAVLEDMMRNGMTSMFRLWWEKVDRSYYDVWYGEGSYCDLWGKIYT